jgi:glycosyltransferase involved in cell wall biosynthesis
MKSPVVVVHLTASTFFGGPERQMLGLARSLPDVYRSVFASFSEGGRCRAFLEEARRQGFKAVALERDTPHLLAAVRELTGLLERSRARVLCCHGYKASLLGRLAARRRGVPVVSVSRGWTGESLKVRVYEALERLNLRWMDRVVCVSQGQAAKVRRAGVPAGQTVVIPNAIQAERFAHPDPEYRERLREFFPRPPRRVVGAAGRLSPEKGFGVLVDAAARVADADPDVGFVLFGEGPLRAKLAQQIAAAGLGERFILAGFRHDLDCFLPFLDLLVLPSFTEGMPNVVLEAFAAGVPVVATAVGGTPELIEEGKSGYLVPPGDPAALARRIRDVLAAEAGGRRLGRRGRERVLRQFTFAAQAERYQGLFEELGVTARREPLAA